ncbi:Tetraspanin-31 [Armadillidium nasatum]|uniref:Tetraspanin-31 n=1 Tax=Armadillidium nasatum TaxID=96803 RepID=A0A5N5TM31_9CRUS|nr:Tetraspanin-31 [Armadillidium nasatum]
MCGGFTCSKNSLIALNVLYVVVAIILISVAAYAKLASIVASTALVSVIIACGVFLLLISIVGIVAASKHHQVLLFFYMIILFLIFIIQFSVACACLATNENQQNIIAREGWKMASHELKHKAEMVFHCCDYEGVDDNENCTDIYDISGNLCCNIVNGTDVECHCPKCNLPLQEALGRGLSVVGGIGLFFSFTEVIKY